MAKLTLEKAKILVKTIEDSKWDYEQARSLEDSLHEQFIYSIYKGHYKTLQEVVIIAKTVIKTSKIDFERYTA